MLRFSSSFFVSSSKTSPVIIRNQLSEAKLAPTPGYLPLHVHRLARKFNHVDESNRFESLNIILKKLSNHVGRRQYAMQHDMTLFKDKFKQVGLDWHELISLPSEKIISIIDHQIGMTPSQRRLFMTVVHTRCCGVLTEGTSAHARNICLNRGLPEHAFRCGKNGHTGLMYFHAKPARSLLSIEDQQHYQRDTSMIGGVGNKKENNIAADEKQNLPILETEFIKNVEEEKKSTDKQRSSKTEDNNKDNDDNDESSNDRAATKFRVSTQPDFRVVGRLFHETHPRAWSAPTVSSFEVATIGYDFYIHPSDPRVKHQLVDAAPEWEIHSEALRNVVWEVLEHHAVERSSSSSMMTTMQRFEVSRSDVRSENDVLDVLKSYYSAVDPETGVIIENVMRTDADEDNVKRSNNKKNNSNKTWSSSRSNTIVTTPWFTPSEPRPVDEETGAPLHFPISPSIAIQCIYRKPSDIEKYDLTTLSLAEQQKRLVEPPYLEFRMFGHRSLCFSWPTKEVRKKAVAEILDVARRVPFALPFTLYFRVDSAQTLSRNNGALRDKRDELIISKRKYFDLSRYHEVWGGMSAGDAEFSTRTSEEDNTNVEVVHSEDMKKKESKIISDDDESDSSKPTNAEQEQRELEALVNSLNPDGWE